MSVQGTFLCSVVGQQDEQSISGLQKSDKGMPNDRIRHYKVVEREVQISFSRKWCTAKEEADLGWIWRGRTKVKAHFWRRNEHCHGSQSAESRERGPSDNGENRGDSASEIKKADIKDTHDFGFWTTWMTLIQIVLIYILSGYLKYT